MIPNVPPALASAAGGAARPNAPAKAPADAAAPAAAAGVEAGGQSGDRDADGRDLSRRRPNPPPDLDAARNDAAGTSGGGGLDVVV